MALYDNEFYREAVENQKEANRVINLIDGSDVPTRPLRFVKAEPKRSVKRELFVKSEPKETRDEHVTVKRERSASREKSRSRSPGLRSESPDSRTYREFVRDVQSFVDNFRVRGYSGYSEVRVVPR